jgi:hypothetical protein
MTSAPRPTGPHHATDFVNRLAARLSDDSRVEGFWLEGVDDSIQWPPYAVLDLHFAVPEPGVEGVRQELLGWMEALDTVADFSQQDAPLKGFAGSARLSDGTALTYRIERTSQIAKVPRKAVNVLIDRSNGLLVPALSFE